MAVNNIYKLVFFCNFIIIINISPITQRAGWLAEGQTDGQIVCSDLCSKEELYKYCVLNRPNLIILCICKCTGHAVAQLVEVLGYKPKSLGFDCRPHSFSGACLASNRN